MNDEPAFPTMQESGFVKQYRTGLSIRDYFAAKALIAAADLCRHDGVSGNDMPTYLAKAAYDLADAMLEARKPKKEKKAK